jgi:hypothetical protein
VQTDSEPHFACRKSLPARSLSLEAFGTQWMTATAQGRLVLIFSWSSSKPILPHERTVDGHQLFPDSLGDKSRYRSAECRIA